jgi:hypothetical protein
VCILEGCYDPHFDPKRSTDGTREFLDGIFRHRVLDNFTASDFVSNQSIGLNGALDFMNFKPNDWVLVITADQYFSRDDIDLIKAWMREDKYDYFTCRAFVFGKDPWMCKKLDYDTTTAVPIRLFKDSKYRRRTQMTRNGVPYPEVKGIRHKKIDAVNYHYFGTKSKERWKLKCSIGDRKKDNEAVKFTEKFEGRHPFFVREHGFLSI